MSVVVAAADPRRAAAVRQAAGAWRRTLGVALRFLEPSDPIDVTRVLRALAAPDVTMAVLPASGDSHDACWAIALHVEKPVLFVPDGFSTTAPRLRTALIPLDGTLEAAAAAAQTSGLLAAAGVELVVLHVFSNSAVPPYWDQGAHAQEVWEAEFRARYCTFDDARITLRSGRPGQHVLAVAEQEHVDVISLGWSRHLDPGRAATVRETVAHATVPVLLTPCVPAPIGPKPL